MHFAYDQDADAVYLTFRDTPVDRTLEIDPLTMVDVDRDGALVGIEVVHPARDWPLEEIIRRFDLSADDRRDLRLLMAPDEDGWLAFGAAWTAA